MNYQYIFFDLDGTITQSDPGIINSVKYALTKMGYEIGEEQKLRKFIGPPLKNSFMQEYGMTEEEAEYGIVCYREYYTEKGIFENSVYDGVIESLEALKKAGKTLVIATSKPEKFAKLIAEHFDFAKYFDLICGATMDEKRVNKDEVISYALDEMHLAEEMQSKVLMIGDRKHDILGGKKNGIDTMGVLFGYGDRAELEAAGADYIVSNALEIAESILSN